MLLVITDVALHSVVSSGRRQVIVQFVCAVSVFFSVSKGSIHSCQSWCGQVPESLGPKESRHRHLLDCSAPSQRVFRIVVDLSNYDRDVVSRAHDHGGKTWHYAVQDVNTISYVVARQNLSLLFVYDGADNDRIVAHEQASRMTCEISTIHGRLQCLSLL